MGKFYAVRKGKKIGIFNTWKECEAQVNGFSGAEYKSFTDLDSAQVYLDGFKNDINRTVEENELIVYVDGSFSKYKNIAGYGCAFIKNGELIHTVSRTVSLNDENLWNVSAEISGALAAVEWAIENGYKSLNIYYDYEGIQKWVDGSWEAKKDSTRKYKEKMKQYAKFIKLNFTKVKAHSGDFYNELVDELAKNALNQIDGEEITQTNQIDIVHNVDFTLYRKIIENTDHSAIQLKLGSFIFNDTVLNKIAKYFWKKDGNKVKDLEGIYINFDLRNLICLISYRTQEKREIQVNIKFVEE